jgi:hypothetical protein
MQTDVTVKQAGVIMSKRIMPAIAMFAMAICFTGCSIIPFIGDSNKSTEITSPHKIIPVSENSMEQLQRQPGHLPDKYQDKLDKILGMLQEESSPDASSILNLCKEGLDVVEKCSYAIVVDSEASGKLQAYRNFFNFVYNRALRLNEINQAYDVCAQAYDRNDNSAIITSSQKYLKVIAEAMSRPELWDAPEIYFLRVESARVNKMCAQKMVAAQIINCFNITRTAVNHTQVADACDKVDAAIRQAASTGIFNYSECAEMNDIRQQFLAIKDKSDQIYSAAYNNTLNKLNLQIAAFVNSCAVDDYNAAKSNYDKGRHRWYWWADDNERLFRAGRLLNRITTEYRVSSTLREQAANLKSDVVSHLNNSERSDMNGFCLNSYETFSSFPYVNVAAVAEIIWKEQYHLQAEPGKGNITLPDMSNRSNL